MPKSLTGVLGILAILAVACLLSRNIRAIRPRVVLAAFALQALIAVLVLYVPAGRAAISWLSGGVSALLDYSKAGINMVFGPLAAGLPPPANGTIFAIAVLPIVVFFASLMAVLYHLGVMQRVVAGIGRLLQWVIGTDPVESLEAAATIFLGQSEAPLAVKPYLGGITDSQLFAMMTVGMASVAGSVLAAYAQLGIKIDYLLAASFMSAPGGLLMAKIIMPETAEAKPQKLLGLEETRGGHENIIQAAAHGAQEGVRLAVAIGGMLIAFVSLIALCNGLLGGVADLIIAGLGSVGVHAAWLDGLHGLTVERILGALFAPIMWLLDIPWAEAQKAGGFFGQKLILNEFVAYANLAPVLDTFSPKTQAILTFALCGFANLSSIAIQLGCLGSMIPKRMGTMARFGLRVVAAGSLANLMSAALAGLMVSG
jgi:CNT family concentrative nucleoside transporter